jgi:hypothetical protein
MKALYLTAFFLFSIQCISQTRPVIKHTEKGMKMFGVQMQLTPSDFIHSETVLMIDDYSSEVGVVVSPNMGWFIEKNWLIGGIAHLGFYNAKPGKNNTSNRTTAKSYDLGLTPFSRYYIDLARRGNIKVFLQGGLPIIYSKYKSSYSYFNGLQTITTKNDGHQLGLYGNFGFGASMHGHFGAIEMNLSNMGLNIGFQKFIGKKM